MYCFIISKYLARMPVLYWNDIRFMMSWLWCYSIGAKSHMLFSILGRTEKVLVTGWKHQNVLDWIASTHCFVWPVVLLKDVLSTIFTAVCEHHYHFIAVCSRSVGLLWETETDWAYDRQECVRFILKVSGVRLKSTGPAFANRCFWLHATFENPCAFTLHPWNA